MKKKWLQAIQKNIQGEIDNISQNLTQRITMLEERYNTPLNIQVETVDQLEKTVMEHLKGMGFSYN